MQFVELQHGDGTTYHDVEQIVGFFPINGGGSFVISLCRKLAKIKLLSDIDHIYKTLKDRYKLNFIKSTYRDGLYHCPDQFVDGYVRTSYVGYVEEKNEWEGAGEDALKSQTRIYLNNKSYINLYFKKSPLDVISEITGHNYTFTEPKIEPPNLTRFDLMDLE